VLQQPGLGRAVRTGVPVATSREDGDSLASRSPISGPDTEAIADDERSTRTPKKDSRDYHQ
jgi:hypothetical protein